MQSDQHKNVVNELDENQAVSESQETVETPTETKEVDLATQLENALNEREEFKSALQRERADFINFKKRIEREKSEMQMSITAKTIDKFLPIVDDFDRAMATAPNNAEENGWMTGFSMIHKKLHDLLNQLGIVEINPLGEPFDPNLHEAIGSEDSDEYESGTVTAVLQKGYKLDDKCIRVAMVKVAN